MQQRQQQPQWHDGAHCASELLADDLAERKPEGALLTALMAVAALLATLALMVASPFLPGQQ